MPILLSEVPPEEQALSSELGATIEALIGDKNYIMIRQGENGKAVIVSNIGCTGSLVNVLMEIVMELADTPCPIHDGPNEYVAVEPIKRKH